TPAAMADAVRLAHAVKDTPARAMLELAAKLLGTETAALGAPAAGTVTAAPTSQAAEAAKASETAGGCCGGSSEPVDVPLVGVAANQSSSGCCG
ncbi:MAG: hypothetical protein ACP5PM_09665, partial [Acidimicrobiales bacterium]